MKAVDIVKSILTGEFNSEELSLIVAAIKQRRIATTGVRLGTLSINQEVVFNDNTHPVYLRGCSAKVIEVKRTRVRVKLDQPIGRFTGIINTHPSLIDIK